MPTPAPGSDRRRGDRRRRPTPAFSRYALFGGRRASDRRNSSDTAAYVDVYEPWLAAALVAIGALCALDAVFTLVYIQQGGEEANPIMDALLDAGPRTFILVKCAITNAGLLVLCMHKNFAHVKKVIGGLLAVYVALFAYHLVLAEMMR